MSGAVEQPKEEEYDAAEGVMRSIDALKYEVAVLGGTAQRIATALEALVITQMASLVSTSISLNDIKAGLQSYQRLIK